MEYMKKLLIILVFLSFQSLAENMKPYSDQAEAISSVFDRVGIKLVSDVKLVTSWHEYNPMNYFFQPDDLNYLIVSFSYEEDGVITTVECPTDDWTKDKTII